MKPYESLLESIRQRAFKECNSDLPERLSTFYEVYADVVKQAAENHKTGGIDALQYEAEKRLSKISWPDEFFPGQPPHLRYVLQLHDIQRKAFQCGISKEEFDKVCNEFARKRFKDPERDFDVKQWKMEKGLWEYFWPNNDFPGVDPRGVQEEHDIQDPMEVFQEMTPPNSQQLPVLQEPKMEEGAIRKADGCSENIPSSSEMGPYHAARDTFLFSILHNGAFPTPISNVIGCIARSEENKLEGGRDVWIRLQRHRRDERDTLERADVLVTNWELMNVDEGWAQMVRVLSDGRVSASAEQVEMIQ